MLGLDVQDPERHRFHDGKKLTVADVIATLKRHSDEGSSRGALG